MSGIEPLLIAGLAAAGTASAGIVSAVQQNQAAEDQKDAAKKAAAVNAGQAREGAAADARDQARRAAAIRGQILAREGGAGGTLLNAVDADLGINLGRINQNLGFNLARIASGLSAAEVQADNAKVSPVLAGVSAGFQGFSGGLGIASGLESLDALENQRKALATAGNPTRITVVP